MKGASTQSKSCCRLAPSALFMNLGIASTMAMAPWRPRPAENRNAATLALQEDYKCRSAGVNRAASSFWR
eukprot:3059226-Alexandrium_andersonii.AAC.1